jgi:biotin synthase
MQEGQIEIAADGGEMRLGGLLISPAPRSDWAVTDVAQLFEAPLNDLLFAAQWVHRQNFAPNQVQISTLLSIKTGACPEDCAYCPQSIRYQTDVAEHELMDVGDVVAAARAARDAGATRFCMGAAYRGPKPKQLAVITEMIARVGALGMETCATLGLLDAEQAEQLKAAGLDYYNHNLDSSAEFYPQVVGTRTYQSRLDTLAHVRDAGLKVCCGGILGMGETRQDRVKLMHTLATMATPPESVPINRLVQIPGTPLNGLEPLDGFEFVRTIGVGRILMPESHLRLSAGRAEFSDELQALAFLAGANSIFYGDKLLTTDNPQAQRDRDLFRRLGLEPEPLTAAAP